VDFVDFVDTVDFVAVLTPLGSEVWEAHEGKAPTRTGIDFDFDFDFDHDLPDRQLLVHVLVLAA
jgi:hypothetical protein